MNDTHLMRFQTRSKSSVISEAARHNLRETGSASIDSSKTHLNLILKGGKTASEVRENANYLLKKFHAGPMRNASRMGEIVFSLPYRTHVDAGAYFSACTEWAIRKFGDESIFSSVVHFDEACPHCHVLLVPVKHGSWLGSRIFGARQDLKLLHQSLQREVASKFGVHQAPARLKVADQKAARNQIISFLNSLPDKDYREAVAPIISESARRDVTLWLERLDLYFRPVYRTLAQLAASPGKGKRPQ